MNAIVKNRYLDALLKLMLFSAIIHIILLVILAIAKADIVLLNYFNILDIDLLFAGSIVGTASQIISGMVVIVLYLVILKLFTKV